MTFYCNAKESNAVAVIRHSYLKKWEIDVYSKDIVRIFIDDS